MIVTGINKGKGVVIFSVKGVSIFAARRVAMCSKSLGGRISVVESTVNEMRSLKDLKEPLKDCLGDFAYLTGDKDIDLDISLSIGMLKDRLDTTGLKGLGSYIIPESFLCSADFAIPFKLLSKITNLKKDKVLGSEEIAELFYLIGEESKKAQLAFSRGRQGGSRQWR